MYFVFKNSTFQQKNGASDSVLNIKSSRLWLRNIYSCPCIFSAVFLCCVLFYFVCIKIYSQVRTYLKKKNSGRSSYIETWPRPSNFPMCPLWQSTSSHSLYKKSDFCPRIWYFLFAMLFQMASQHYVIFTNPILGPLYLLVENWRTREAQ